MKYVFQFSIIFLISLIGELLSTFIPLPIPASIYGLIIMLILLSTKLLKVSQVKETADFLIEIMPLMFIPVTVGIMNSYKVMASILPEILIITILGTALVLAVSGYVTQQVIHRAEKKRRKSK